MSSIFFPPLIQQINSEMNHDAYELLIKKINPSLIQQFLVDSGIYSNANNISIKDIRDCKEKH
jgi:hypothetical protein